MLDEVAASAELPIRVVDDWSRDRASFADERQGG
jgi:hypothetical protein